LVRNFSRSSAFSMSAASLTGLLLAICLYKLLSNSSL
jgi:hypothetical protein